MNKEQIYVAFRKKVESDDNYYTFGKTGIIEETLAYFGIPMTPFIAFTPAQIHETNLKKLYDFIKTTASNEQLALIYEIATGKKQVPEMNPILNSSGNVFVSMPMNKEKYDCVDTIRAGTEKAIIQTRNTPYYLDLDAHNGNIFDKMLAEIQSCKFLVADFTYQNEGVYYEAGYAKGIGKTVIHTCRDDDFGNIHFDIEQIQFVIWKDAMDLEHKLKEQIQKSQLSGQ